MSGTWWKDEDDLVPEQAKFLELDASRNILIKGPPGSGKTNLLLLRANQLYLGDRPNLHIVVFGSLLQKFIRLGGHQYSFPAEKVVTHLSLFKDLLLAEGQASGLDKMEFESARAERASRLHNLIESGKIGVQFEALLLDEAQDYTPLEIRIMRRLTEVLIATADSRQKIYETDSCEAELASSMDDVYPLKFHFRNGLSICRVADGIFKGDNSHTPLVQHSNYKEKDYPSACSLRPGLSIAEQAASMAEQIADQRFAYPDEIIGVLCPRKEDLQGIEAGLISAGLGASMTRAGSEDFDPEKPIWLSTLTSAKGLEFRAVHIGGLDSLSKMRAVQKRLIYTGITRAKTALTLYWDKSIPGYLDSAVQVAAPKKSPVTMKNIFGKK